MNKEYFGQERTEMLSFIPKGSKRVLDSGCSAGYFGMLVKSALKAEVWGIEVDKSVCKIASRKLDKTICGTLEQKIPSLPDKYFDCIVFNDILEHLVDPWGVLKKSRTKLAAGGTVVASIPNFRRIYNLLDIVIKKRL